MAEDQIGKIANWIVLVGALNWGVAGVGGLIGNATLGKGVVNLALGSIPMVENVVYIVVGLSALWALKGMFMK
ncbi:DUF378 domain-containing protein [Candidatus Woesearchaeota archaeon]|nr:DUF378 domain-containing protein [Candidatus Woesearchaeota archaeon]